MAANPAASFFLMVSQIAFSLSVISVLRAGAFVPGVAEFAVFAGGVGAFVLLGACVVVAQPDAASRSAESRIIRFMNRHSSKMMKRRFCFYAKSGGESIAGQQAKIIRSLTSAARRLRACQNAAHTLLHFQQP